MRSSRIFMRLFTSSVWDVAYRQIGENELLPKACNYRILRATANHWYADPFCVLYDGNYYLFVEIMNLWRGIGTIGVTKWNKDGWGAVKEIIREKFHLSYPNVFSYRGEMYMIPECARGHQLRLYKVLNFPDYWVLDTVLLDGIDLVDNTLIIEEDEIYLLSLRKGDPKHSPAIFRLDMEAKAVFSMPAAAMAGGEQGAGNVLYCNGVRYRPVQDGNCFYGEKINLRKICASISDGYQEEPSGELTVSSVMMSADPKYRALHTFNRCAGMEVIDLGYTRICLLKPLQKAISFLVARFERLR